MTILSASKARIPPDVFNRVVYRGERLHIKHRSGATAVLISESDLEELERAARREEDRRDAEEVRKAHKEIQKEGTVPWKEVKKRLGL